MGRREDLVMKRHMGSPDEEEHQFEEEEQGNHVADEGNINQESINL